MNGLKLKGISQDTSHLKSYQFKKGQEVWNKGQKGYKLKIKYPRKDFTKSIEGLKEYWDKNSRWHDDEHPSWKGDDVKYVALHQWVNKHKGRANQCSNIYCPGISSTFDWANIDSAYKRNLDDFVSLCRSCHMRYDKSTRTELINEL